MTTQSQPLVSPRDQALAIQTLAAIRKHVPAAVIEAATLPELKRFGRKLARLKPGPDQVGLQERQYAAATTPATEIFYGGAAYGGKSHFDRAVAIHWCCEIPGLRVFIFRRTFPELQKTHIEGGLLTLLRPMIAAGHVRFNRGRSEVIFNHPGHDYALLSLNHAQHEDDVEAYDSAEFHVLIIDEASGFTPKQITYLRHRVRRGSLELPERWQKVSCACGWSGIGDDLLTEPCPSCGGPVHGFFPRIIYSSNPLGPAHNFFKLKYVDPSGATPARPMGDVIQQPDEEGGMLRQFILARYADNPEGLKKDPDYPKRLMGIGDPQQAKAKLEGDFNVTSGGMIDDLWSPDAHICDPFRIPASWEVFRAMDYGSSKPFSVGWWARSDATEVVVPESWIGNANKRDAGPGQIAISWPRGSLIRISEWYGWSGEPNVGLKLSTEALIQGIREREKELGLTVQRGPGDVPDSKDQDIRQKLAAAGLQFDAPDKRPGSRVAGATVIRDMLSAALPPKGEEPQPIESPCLMVFRGACTDGFVRTMPTLQRDKRKTDDVDTHAEDHPWDETRYACTTPRFYFGSVGGFR